MTAPAGVLVLVGTPIGNLGDLAPRAIEALGRADVVACEDTRRTGRLLQHAGVRAPRLLVANEHTEARAADEVVALLRQGRRVAVVSDAGMPGVSDPGARLVRAALDAGATVEVVPGPSAAMAALVLSGLPADRFAFEGFLPRRGSARQARLAELAGERRTMVLYEAPHRIERTIADLAAALGDDRPVAVARELTKLHEEVWRGHLADAVAWAGTGAARGELVLVVAGRGEAPAADDDELRRAVTEARAQGRSVRDAVALVAATHDVPKRRVYALALDADDPDAEPE